MAKNDNLTDFLTDVADAIRAKKGTTDKINPQNFSAEIASITTGGGDSDMPVIGDGKTYLYINIENPDILDTTVTFSQTVAAGVVVDWGDGSETQTYTGTGNKNATHTYAEVGEYRISLAPIEGCTLRLSRSANTYCVMGLIENRQPYLNVLKAVEIGSNVTTVGNYTFQYCFGLENIVIPEGVKTLGTEAFAVCYSLKSIVIPEGVTTINSNNFSSCYALSRIVMPSTVTKIDSWAFLNCYSLTNVILPNKLKTLTSTTFNNCRSLTSIVIPPSVTTFGSNMFVNCSTLKSVVLPTNLTDIPAYTFDNCSSLTNIEIPTTVTSIENYAFGSCSSLTNIIIPPSVNSLGNSVFNGCSKLKTCDFSQHTSVPSLGTNAFKDVLSTCKIKVPAALLTTWKAATNWSTYASMIVSA
jgi:hypothetical protein